MSSPLLQNLLTKSMSKCVFFAFVTHFQLAFIFVCLGSSSSRHPNQVTPKKSGLKNGQMKSKDDECFGDDIDEIPDTDFDFEGNLALFDKAAVFEEIETYERRSGTRSRGTPNEKPARYRHDENILESEPIVYRRIVVPQNANKEFCTGMPHPLLIRMQTLLLFWGTCGGLFSPRGVCQLNVVQARALIYLRLDLCLVSTYNLHLQYFRDKKYSDRATR